MASPASQVASVFSQAAAYANAATSGVSSFINTLNGLVYTPATIDIQWQSVAAPSIPALPAMPSIPSITFNPQSAPDTALPDAPEIAISTFDEAAPVVNLPSSPTLNYGPTPEIPEVGAVALPNAPTLGSVAVPTYLTLEVPQFGGLNLHEDYLQNLQNIPTLELVEPTPYSYTRGPAYTSSLLSALSATLNQRLAGGTGLPANIEQAIWGRARDRETRIAQANIDEVQRTSDALGFQLPAGVVLAQQREAQQVYYEKLADVSRDISIKQAELEQANLKDTIAAGIQLESQLIDYSYKMESLAFESAKAAAEVGVQIYNAQVEQYKALLSAYQTYATVYRTLIEGELAKVEVYKAEIAGEQAKADINNALVQQYKAQIDAQMSQVNIYEAQVGAAKVLVELEQSKISAAGERVRAYVAQINAETAKVEAYKAGVSAEATKVEIYKIKADAFASKVSGEAEQARLQTAVYTGRVQAKTSEWEGYRARVEAERARMQSLASSASALTDAYRAGAAATEARANSVARMWETQIAEYAAGREMLLKTTQINTENLQFSLQAQQEAAKVGAQVYAQLASSAYSMMNANASVSASASDSVSYSYSNDTVSAAPTRTQTPG